jgi:hypothetical protein
MNVRSTALRSVAMVTLSGLMAACGSSPAPSTSTPASAGSASELEGSWVTPETTCEEQHAALGAAGFSPADLETAGWDEETCGGMMHGARFTIRFVGDRLVAFNDDVTGWDGHFRIVDADTFEAGDAAGDFYITYDYALDGDELTIDMVRNEFPTSSEAELIGERVAQTVIYETAPFRREP